MNPKPSNGWIERINRSTYFWMAVFLHVLVLLFVATWVIIKSTAPPEPPQFVQIYIPKAPIPPSPPSSTDVVTTHAPNLVSPDDLTPATVSPMPIAIRIQAPVVDLPAGGGAGVPPPRQTGPPPTGPSPEQLKIIRETVAQWFPLSEIPDIDSDLRELKTSPFPIYLAIYAHGDWSCNNYGSPTQMTAGCLPNLAAQMKVWSKDHLITGTIKPIRIDSPELLSNPPPFIFFTGHSDFVLTEAEIENLQKYLQMGGAIWGDSAFAGDGSRFDVAFHREMKRVLPDADANFEPLNLSDDIFAHGYFPISTLAAGMNYRRDPIQVINLEGKLAVIYTPNDYGDMMTMLLKTGTQTPETDTLPPTPDHPLFTPSQFMGSRTYFYRNYDPQSASEVYRLATNIVVHLLTRFDDEIGPDQ